ncbi:MAG: tetratricopeptide repeat protein, partial [Phycisphaerales bacterium JB059]
MVAIAVVLHGALLTITTVVSIALVRTNAANARALLARENALTEADKQSRMNVFLRRMLTAVEPGNAGPDLSVVELLQSAEDRIETEFAEYPDLRAQLHSTMGQTYWRLGQPEPAARHQRLAIGLLEQLGDSAPPADLPAALSALGSIEQTLGHLDRSEELHRRAIERWNRPDLLDDTRRHRARVNLAALLSATGRADEAERLYRAVLDDVNDPDDESRILRAQALVSLGALLHPQERHTDAMNAYDEALPILRQLRGDEHPDTLACLTNSAEVLVSLGEHDRAERIMREMIETRGRVFGPRHERVAVAINNLADFYRVQDRPEEAIPLFERARSIFAEALGERHYRVAMVAHNLGLTLTRSGRPHDAIDHLRFAEEVMARTVPDTHWILAQMRLSLGECLHALDRDDEAHPLVTQAHDRLLAHFGPDHSRTIEAQRLISALDRADPPPPRTPVRTG